MESFVIRPMTWPVLRVFSRNHLVRTSDRIEAAVTALAVLLVVVAAAAAGVLGTMIHDVNMQTYLEQAKTRHAVVATAVGDSTQAVAQEPTASTVYVRWQDRGIGHADLVTVDHVVKAGEPLQIWVDGKGNPVDRPTPIERAGTNAVGAAAVAWLVAVLITSQLVGIVRAHATRMRAAQWDREIQCLVDDGGRTNHSQ